MKAVPPKGFEAVFTDLVDRCNAIDIDGKDPTVLWARTQAYSLHAGVVSRRAQRS